MRSRLYRYRGIRISSRRYRGMHTVRIDLGFNVFRNLRMAVPRDTPQDTELVFDIAKRGGKYRSTSTHDEWNKLYKYRAKIEKIYDGDTVTRAVIDLGFGVEFEVPLRLSGIDTPEMRGDERPEGIIARDRLRELILGNEVVIETEKDKTGKYGRYLATIYYKGKNINQQLLEEGLADVYGK